MLCVLSRSVVSDSLQPHGLQPVRLLCPWGFSRRKYWSGLPCPPGHHSNPGIEPSCPALQADSLPSEPPGKPKNAEMDSLSLLQGIFPSQGLNCGLFFAGGFFTSWATTEVHPTAVSRCLIVVMVDSTVSSVMHLRDCWLGSTASHFSLWIWDLPMRQFPGTHPCRCQRDTPISLTPLPGLLKTSRWIWSLYFSLSSYPTTVVGNVELLKDIFFCFSFDAGDFAYHYVHG